MSEIIEEVFTVIEDRRDHPKPCSYVSELASRGLEGVLKKIEEEATELVAASKKGDRNAIICESVDLIFHVLILLAFKFIPLNDVFNEFRRRRK